MAQFIWKKEEKNRRKKKKKYKLTARQMKLWTPEFEICLLVFQLSLAVFGCLAVSAVVAATRLHKAHLTSALAHCPVFSELGVGLSIGN